MIDKRGILHIPLSKYAFASAEDILTIRIRSTKGDVEKINLYYGDRAYPENPVVFTKINMEKIASDEFFDYYSATFKSPYTRVCYYFELIDNEEKIYYFADLFLNEIPKERWEFYQFPFIRREELQDVPSWLKESIVYNIFPDSFASSKECIENNITEMKYEGNEIKTRLGGTIKGVHENLDYIQDMGFNCIYFNPIFVAGEYHKYDLLDYFHISPNLGSDEEFKNLVDDIHKRGMKVIIDGVFNHCSWYFFAFDDVVKNGKDSKYVDWFYGLEFPVIRPDDDSKPNYSCFAYEKKMPKLNTSNPEVLDYFSKVARYWIEEFGVDGWRIDVANEVDKSFWRAFKKSCNIADPDSILIGEIWENAETWIAPDLFDSAMNYDFRRHLRDFVALNKIDAKGFEARISQMLLRYPTGMLEGQLNLLDSHDVSRFLYLCENDVEKMKLALVYLFTSKGVPCVFYGDELGISGVEEFEYRAAMPWENISVDFRSFIKKLTNLRNNKTFVYGDYKTVYSNSGLYIFERAYEEVKYRISINGMNNEEEMPFRVDEKNVIFTNSDKFDRLSGKSFIIERI